MTATVGVGMSHLLLGSKFDFWEANGGTSIRTMILIGRTDCIVMTL